MFIIPSHKNLKRVTLRELVAIFERVTQAPLRIEWGGRPYRQREVMEPWGEGRPLPGWTPRVGLEEGLARTLSAGQGPG